MQFLPFLTLNEGCDTHPHIVNLKLTRIRIKIAPLNQFWSPPQMRIPLQ